MSRRERDPNRISLLIRNLPLDVRPEDVRDRFEKYGEIRDVYLPKDYYSGRPRGFGFIEFRDPRDAEEALYHLDRSNFMGREITVCMSKESRKTPRDMIQRERVPARGGDRGGDRGYGRDRDRDRDRGHRGGGDRSRSPGRRRYSGSRSPPRGRGRGRSYSRSPPRRGRSRSRSRSPVRRDSPPPRYDDDAPRRSCSRSPVRERSPRDDRSPARDAGDNNNGSSPVRERSPARGGDGDGGDGGSPGGSYEHGAASPPRSPRDTEGYDD